MATIEIDGQTLEAENGKMIIEVANDAGIHIPHFCYHKKLSVAANCRMCLVEIENNRKPMPACATPITHGMKVFTKSPEAIRSQQAVMEFLLINHPLDCPICDQGGECELQDISMGYGYAVSEFTEKKRAVDDENLGSLVETEMTRCIHCTRCVRFGDEIAGLRELGGLGRGENMEISTYVAHSLESEVSGNIIDLCPVGALTSKPFRFKARAWEMSQHESIAPHDCLGSNVYLHVRRNELMRVVPRDNETLNETWLSDRDRFSYLGITDESRALQPRIKVNGLWQIVDWETALTFTAEGMKRVIKQHGPTQFAAFASPSATTEECYLLQKFMRSLGVQNLDHRLQQTDFRDETHLPTLLTNSLQYRDIENQAAVLLLGCHIQREVPLASLRVRKAFKNGATISAINPVDYAFPFEIHAKSIISPQKLPEKLAALVLVLVDEARLSADVKKLLANITPDAEIKAIAKTLSKPNAVVITGALFDNHPEAALLRTLIQTIKTETEIKHIHLSTGANAAGARLAGMLPDRTVAGQPVASPGLAIQKALESRLKGYLLHAADPSFDFANPYGARQSMLAAEFVVMLTACHHDGLDEYADVILPIAPYAETSGTYINLDECWQTVKGVVKPAGEARPAWKIFRVLANLLQCKGFDYLSTDDVLAELKQQCVHLNSPPYRPFTTASLPKPKKQLIRIGEWPLYRIDTIVRNAKALQDSSAADKLCIRIHPETAKRLALKDQATVSQGDIAITLPLEHDERIAKDSVWVANALQETMDLGHSFDEIIIS